jgi:predicted dehydrogenase
VVECQYRGFRNPAYYSASKWKGKLAFDGGGCLMNQGIHAVDAMLYLAGPVAAVCGETGIRGRDIEVENLAAALLRFQNGARGVLMGTTLSFAPEGGPEGDRIRIECEKGSIVYADGKTTYYRNDDPDGFDVTAIPLDDDPAGAVSGSADPSQIDMRAHQTIVSDFITAVIEKREPLVSADSARRSVDTILAVYRSAKSGKWETVTA